MSKVSIIGAGNVGATAAFMVLQKKLADVVLVDIVDSVKGKALDMGQAGAIEGFFNTVKGTTDFSEIKDSEIVVLTAGFPRKPGMTREDLFEANSKIVKNALTEIRKHCPNCFLIIVTNPLDLMVDLAVREGFDRKKVVGQSGVLDSARFKYFLGHGAEGMVIGYHSDDMVPLVSSARIKGKEISLVLKKEKINEVVARTKNGGAEIGTLLGTSAYYAPGAAIAKMVEAVLKDTNEVLPCCAHIDGAYGLKDVCIGVPCKLGKQGIEIIEIKISEEEKNSLHDSINKRK